MGINPYDVTFISVLSTCSHASLVKEGYQYLKSMNDYYPITPTMEYYKSMVDIISLYGHLDEIKDYK